MTASIKKYRTITPIISAQVAAFLAHEDFYHPICRKMVSNDLGLGKVKPAPLKSYALFLAGEFRRVF